MIPVSGISFSATLDDEGYRYYATVLVNETGRYDLIQPGMVGERIPLQPINLTVRNETSSLEITPDRGELKFPKGNYSISY
ncbi:MAG: hypothetical protein GX268_06350 [Methanomicrobiales archaeon]|jgi:hypothetical protein|nr:hypothetical protein [Methanomicrobiales archaeon]